MYGRFRESRHPAYGGRRYSWKSPGRKTSAREIDEKVLKLTSEYIDDGFAAFYKAMVRFVTWNGVHVGFSLRQSDPIIFTIQAFNKVVKRMHAETVNEDMLHRGFVMASLIPAKLRRGLDYFTHEDADLLAAIAVLNARTAKDRVDTTSAAFWSELLFHTTEARIVFTEDDERITVLFPFNYWALRQLGSVFLDKCNICNEADWSWLALPPADRQKFMMNQSG
jgi:hypothetical protein